MGKVRNMNQRETKDDFFTSESLNILLYDCRPGLAYPAVPSYSFDPVIDVKKTHYFSSNFF
jgi:hypothetical protein